MPKFLKDILTREYPGNPHAVYGTMNKIGAMHGNKVTVKGERMQAQHDAKQRALKSTMPTLGHPHKNLGRYLHPKKSR